MHMFSGWIIPVCIRALHKSPYAYRDPFFGNPHMHTRIKVTLCMRTAQIMQHRWCFLMCALKKILLNTLLKERLLICQNLVLVCLRWLPICIRGGRQKIRIWGLPIRIIKLCAYGNNMYVHVLCLHLYCFTPPHRLSTKLTQRWLLQNDSAGTGNGVCKPNDF